MSTRIYLMFNVLSKCTFWRMYMKKLLCCLMILIILFTLGACGKKQTYTVTFDSLGGNAIESQIIEKGSKVKKPTDPQKEGFTFVEWQYESKTFDFDTPIDSDILLTAFYTINEGVETITIAFNADNGEGVKTVNIAKGATVGVPPDPIKSGYKFLGWFLDSTKFDFNTALEKNTILIAKWDVDKNSTDESKSNGTSKPSTSNKTDNSSSTDSNTKASGTNHTINFVDVEGTWYVEGHDDASLTFSIDSNTWIFLDAKGFDYYTCELKPNTGRGGTEYFYDNGKFYSEEISLEGKNKLIYTKNNKSVVFYRQKNYPSEKLWPHEQLLKEIDGYYWYLDGYEYTYLYPTIIPWYDHKCLQWESKNIQIYENKLTAYEKYEYDAYQNINSQASSNTHNTLLVNPVEHADRLIEEYKMRVNNGKLYMTVGGKEYSFTKYTKTKDVKTSITPNKKELNLVVGDMSSVDITIAPFWKDHSISAKSSNENVVFASEQHTSSSNGKITISIWANKVGTATITIQDKTNSSSTTVKVTVSPCKASGVTLNKTSIQLEKGGTETLTATVNPSNASNKNVTWSSSDTSVATVSSSGKITAKGKGSAVITVKTDDGGYTASCEVNVKEPKLTVSASIGIGYYASSSSNVRGVFCQVKPSGGSGNYVEYAIKLYYNGTLVAEASKNEVIVTPVKNGSYTAEVYVKDSSGNEATATQTTTISY